MSFLIPSFTEVIEIVIITFIIYQCLLWIKNKGNIQILLGVILIILVYFISKIFKLDILTSLFGSLKNYWILVFIILYQTEIREYLSKLNVIGSLKLNKSNDSKDEYNSILIDAISAMSFRRIGALIVIELKDSLDEFINTSELIDSKISLRLILSIFNPKSVLHDGALIIRKGRIIAAKAVLPLSNNAEYKKIFGTRHLAAIGLSEITDAVIIIVSEHTGRISIASDRIIRTDIAFEELMQIVTDVTKK